MIICIYSRSEYTIKAALLKKMESVTLKAEYDSEEKYKEIREK